jgi:hypothetical protein
MTKEQLAETEAKIISAGKLILSNCHLCETVTKANKELTDVLADIERDINVIYAQISMKKENSGKPAAHIKRLWKAETVEEVRLYSIAKGYKKTLNNIEYNLYK